MSSRCNSCGKSQSASFGSRAEWLKAIVTFAQDTGANSLDLSGRGLKLWEALSVLRCAVNSQITEIDFTGISLADGLETFLQTLGQTKLDRINLRDCMLTAEDLIPLMNTVKDLKVNSLDISCNNICFDSALAAEFVSLLVQSHITRLRIDWRKIIKEGGATLAQSLPRTSLTHLNLYGLELEPKLYSFMNPLILNLQHTAITNLCLMCNNLEFTDLKQLSEVLKDSKIEQLLLSSNKITDAGVDVLMRGLINSKVICLDLCYNMIEGNNNLGHYLKHTAIRTLKLHGNPITQDKMFNFPDFLKGSSVSTLVISMPCAELGQKLMKSLQCTEVIELKVFCDKFPASRLEFFNGVKFTNITDVSISGKGLSHEMISDLGNSLKESKLRYIYLSNCHTSIESTALADFIEKTKESSVYSLSLSIEFKFDEIIVNSFRNTTFTDLGLDSCGLNPADILKFGAALRFTAVTFLSLKGNTLGDEGMETLAQCLRGTQVVSLNVSSNKITCVGAKALADTLKDTNLLSLALEGNEISICGLYYLAEQISRTYITVLDTDLKSECKDPLLAIEAALCQNRKIVQQLTDFFKRIVPETSNNTFQFGSVNSRDLNSSLEDCLNFYKTIVERPSSLCALAANEPGNSSSKSQITTLLRDELPRQLAMFVARNVEADVTQHVNFLKRTQELCLNQLTELLLLNRPLYVIDEDQDILHPTVYKLMHRFKQPIVNSSVEPGGEEKIINYFTSHKELEGATDVISLLRQNVNNSTPKDETA